MVGSTVTEAHQGLKGRVDATVTIGAKEAGDYSIGIFLVEDNVSAFQVGAPGSIYNHADIVRHLGTDLFGDAIGSMTAGQTIEKEFTMTIEDSYKLEDLSLVIYTTYKEGGYSVIDNIVKVPAAGQTGFNYAD